MANPQNSCPWSKPGVVGAGASFAKLLLKTERIERPTRP
jgi:hypothetical protein